MRRFFMAHTLFISDLHLSADHPHSLAAFGRFIATLAPKAEALYILGDLFEYWAGDDDLHDPFHQQVISALRSLSAHATQVFLMHGNRDLLIGETLTEACGAKLLTDPTLIDLYGTPTLLCHGDTLCTDDVEYQRFRSHVHSLDFTRHFLAKPLAERKAYIKQLRTRSETEKQNKNSAIMDVNDDAVACLLREYNYPRIIHGHTHRPKRHVHMVDGHLCERWVLGDWDHQGSALRCDSSGTRWETIPD
jgi:UDP-2,3-diacylglucosamine hydrolase